MSEKEQKIMKFALEVEDQIVIGDYVTIVFSKAKTIHNGLVMSIPKCHGDPWVIKKNGLISYVGNFEIMTKNHQTISHEEMVNMFNDVNSYGNNSGSEDSSLPF